MNKVKVKTEKMENEPKGKKNEKRKGVYREITSVWKREAREIDEKGEEGVYRKIEREFRSDYRKERRVV